MIHLSPIEKQPHEGDIEKLVHLCPVVPFFALLGHSKYYQESNP